MEGLAARVLSDIHSGIAVSLAFLHVLVIRRTRWRRSLGRARGGHSGEIKTSRLSFLWYQGTSLHTSGQAHFRRPIGTASVELGLRRDGDLLVRLDQRTAMEIRGDPERRWGEIADEHPHGLPGGCILSLLGIV